MIILKMSLIIKHYEHVRCVFLFVQTTFPNYSPTPDRDFCCFYPCEIILSHIPMHTKSSDPYVSSLSEKFVPRKISVTNTGSLDDVKKRNTFASINLLTQVTVLVLVNPF